MDLISRILSSVLKKNFDLKINIDIDCHRWYPKLTLCTAYKSTVQTEQTIGESQGVGPSWQWNLYIHGTVVTNTESWVFFYTLLDIL